MKLDSRRNSGKRITCFTCGAPGHTSSECEKKKGRWCSICKTKSHPTNKCRKKKDAANKSSTSSSDHSIAFKASDTLNVETPNNAFLVDCGATTHIVNDKSRFIDTDPTFNQSSKHEEK